MKLNKVILNIQSYEKAINAKIILKTQAKLALNNSYFIRLFLKFLQFYLGLHLNTLFVSFQESVPRLIGIQIL